VSRYLQRIFQWDISEHADSDSVSFLNEVAEGLGSRPLLVPTFDDAVIFLARNAEVLKENFLFPVQSLETITSFCNKQELFRLARKLRQAPIDTGSGSYGKCIWNQEVTDLATTLAQAVGYAGIVDIDYRYDRRDGTWPGKFSPSEGIISLLKGPNDGHQAQNGRRDYRDPTGSGEE
jgi:predicted ATP-grasp superfamily ATP-dependent carboligase